MLRLWAESPQALQGCVIVAPERWLRDRAEILGIHAPIARLSAPEAPLPPAGALAVFTPPSAARAEAVPVETGRPARATAGTVLACIRQAAESCLAGTAAGMVTGPIEKAVLRDAGFDFPGHTEYLAHLAGDAPYAMMLANPKLRVSLLTTHLPLAEVPGALNERAALEIIRITHADLIRRFGIDRPKLALCGLNPHAGEQGHFGDEERRILAPAVRKARALGLDIEGPWPADSLFTPRLRQRFDAILACYHDQGLIPVKMLGFGETVNITLGLPFVRTSVDHGTALGLAGKPGVDPGSLAEAIETARRMAQPAAMEAAA